MTCKVCGSYFGTDSVALAKHQQGHVTNARLAGFLDPNQRILNNKTRARHARARKAKK